MYRSQLVIHVATLVVISVSVLAAPALAQDCPELVGRLPGPIHAVAVSGIVAHLATDASLVIADVSDPSTPRVIGELAVPNPTLSVAVQGRFAYVAEYAAGLRVVDVSTPSAPVAVGFIGTPGHATGVAVEGGLAYVADSHEGLRVIDVTMPSAPVEVGFVDTPGFAVDVAVSGGNAYIADSTGGLRVVDVSTPSAPFEVGFVDTTGTAVAVAVLGDYAYLADGVDGFRVIDVSISSAPVEVGLLEFQTTDVTVSGRYAYVGEFDSGEETGSLRVIDVSTPSAPVEVGLVDTLGYVDDVALSAEHAYVGLGHNGLSVIDVSAPSAPLEAGFLATPYTSDLAMSGGYAYGVGGDLRVIDVTTPSIPTVVASLATPGRAWRVAVAAGYAYVTWTEGSLGDTGLSVVDVSMPSTPVEVGLVHNLAYPPAAVAVSGNHAYVAGDGLQVIDVSTPSAPEVVGVVETPFGCTALAVSGGYAYVSYGVGDEGGLQVIDVSNPSAPVEVGLLTTPREVADVTVSGHVAYLANDVGGLRVIDVSSPWAPVEVGFIVTPGPARDVEVSRGYAYVGEGSQGDRPGGVRVIDVCNPAAPAAVGFAGTSSYSSVGMAASGGYVLVGAPPSGLYVFRECAGGPPADGRVSFIPAAAVAAGAQGAFFSTDVEINNRGTEETQVVFEWLPRGEDNTDPRQSDPIALAPGQSLRYENVLTELFGLGPDSLGALKMVASNEAVIGTSRTYNTPAGTGTGTFGQGLPAIRATEMITCTEPQRIIFLSEGPGFRANVGCVNGTGRRTVIHIGIFDDEGTILETKTMDLGPYSNNQINRVFRDYQPVNGYVDVWADSDEALYYCYGSMLDNSTSDPNTILPQVPSADTTFIPAAALSAGLEGSFFQTDLDLNNVGSTDLIYELLWLPRGANNTDAIHSDVFSLEPGAGVRYSNVLDEVFDLESDQLGALAVEASGSELLAMSRTYNTPSAKVAGTFGQELPGIPADRMIPSGVKKRIIFMNENDDVRSNVGCQNAGLEPATVKIELHNAAGERLGTRTMDLPPRSNDQMTRVFRNHAPISAGYVDVWTDTEGASIYCYGSVLDNLTSDPTTVLPQ